MKKILTKKQIAEKMGKSLVTIYRWLNGTCPMTADDARKMEVITGVKAASWIFHNKKINPYLYDQKPREKKNEQCGKKVFCDNCNLNSRVK
jgi:transcriptional regulator with XRE-family HTH domain